MAKMRCKNCDAVLDAVGEEIFGGICYGYYTKYKCYHCGSTDLVRTQEPYRLPKSERLSNTVKAGK